MALKGDYHLGHQTHTGKPCSFRADESIRADKFIAHLRLLGRRVKNKDCSLNQDLGHATSAATSSTTSAFELSSPPTARLGFTHLRLFPFRTAQVVPFPSSRLVLVLTGRELAFLHRYSKPNGMALRLWQSSSCDRPQVRRLSWTSCARYQPLDILSAAASAEPCTFPHDAQLTQISPVAGDHRGRSKDIAWC